MTTLHRNTTNRSARAFRLGLLAATCLAWTGGIGLAAPQDVNLTGNVFDIGSTGSQTVGLLTGTGTVTLGGNTLTFGGAGNGAFAGAISGVGGITKAGSGVETLSGVNTYTWQTNITAGTLAIGLGGSIATSSGVNIQGGTFDISAGGNTVIGRLNGAAGTGVNLGANTLTLDSSNCLCFGSPDFGAYSGVISGSGGLVVINGGTRTLDGTNTYTGLTIIGSATPSAPAAASNTRTNLVTIDTPPVLYPGIGYGGAAVLSGGAGGLGGYTAGRGPNVLQIGNGGTSGSIAGDILDDDVLVFNRSDTLSLAGRIFGSGRVVQAGSGTTVLTAAETYTGTTTIQAGTLAIGAGGSLGPTVVTLNGGALDLSGGGNQTLLSLNGVAGTSVLLGANTLTLNGDSSTLGTFGGTIAGTGGLALSGGLQQVLTGANTYTGLTTIGANAGLYIGSGFGTSSIVGNVSNSGSLVFDSTFTYGGSISGPGAVIQDAFTTVTLTGASTYTGPTLVYRGAVALGAGGSIAGSSGVYLQGGNLDISNGGNQTIGALYGTYYGAGRSAVILGANTLTFGGAADAVFDGAITGTGGIVKAGSGTQTFGVSRSSLGSVSVQAGALVLGRGLYPVTFNLSGGFSQSSGATSVLAGSTLVAGSMALSGGSVLIDGRASAGSGASVANAALVVGDSATPTAILAANVNLGTGGLLRGHGTIVGNVVNGAGTMFPGGSIGVLTVNGNYVQSPGGTLAIEVTPNAAAGPGVGYSQLLVTGTASLAGGLAVQLDSGSYVVGSRYTVLHANGGVSGGFASVAASPGFAAYLTPQVTYDATDAIVQLVLAQTAAGVVPAFDTGRGMVANQFVVNHSLFAAMGAVLDGAEPQGGGRTDVARGSWMTALGGFGRANGFDTQSGGVVVGHGVAVSADWTVGAAVSGLFTGTSGGVSKIDGQSVGVQAYGIYRQDRLRVSGMVGVGLLSDQSSRFLPPLGLSGRASNDGWYTGLATRAQYRLGTDRLSVEPYAEAMVLHTDLGGATETGAGMLNLRYGAIRNDLARLAVGVRVATVLPTAFGGMKPWAQLGAAGTLGNPRIREAETLGVLQGSVQADAARAGEVDLGAGVTMVDTGPWTLSAEWGGQYGGGATANLFSLKGRYVW